MQSVLITGGSGLLGRTMTDCCGNLFAKIYYTYNQNNVFFLTAKGFKLDLRQPEEVVLLFKSLRPDIVMHLAALTDLVTCQENPELCLEINSLATGNVARAAGRIGAKVVYMSSDFVFDGGKGNYVETDMPVPVNVYAKCKLLGENAVSHFSDQNLIIRGTFYGLNTISNKHTYLGKIISSLHQGVPLKMANDSYFTPLPVHTLAKAILQLVINGQAGTWHLGSTDICSRYVFASQVASVFNLPCTSLQETSHAVFQDQFDRPRDVSLDVSKASRHGIKLPTVRQGLQMYKEYFEQLHVKEGKW